MVTFPLPSRASLVALSLILFAFASSAANNESANRSNSKQSSVKPGAQSDHRIEKVELSKDHPSVALDGVIHGYQTVDYLVEARAGQILTISFRSSNLASYFNVLEPNTEIASFNGAMLGNSYTNTLSSNGSYTIRVYMMRNAAARKENARYTVNLSLFE